MGNLHAFLAPNVKKIPNERFVLSERFLNEDGTPAEWEIRCISAEEDDAIREACTKTVPVPGKYGQYRDDFDLSKYLGELAARGTVHPNLADQELQASYGCMGAVKTLKTMLTQGEYGQLLARIQALSGNESVFAEKVEEAKNV
jgi:hypothetical protein